MYIYIVYGVFALMYVSYVLYVTCGYVFYVSFIATLVSRAPSPASVHQNVPVFSLYVYPINDYNSRVVYYSNV